MILLAQHPKSSYKNPNYENCNYIVQAANDVEDTASIYLEGRTNSNWSNRKRIKKSRKEYIRAAQIYSQANYMDCVEGIDLILKEIHCLNQAEKFNESEKLLENIIKDSTYNYEFFNSYFLTMNKESRIKDLRKNGRLYYLDGYGVDWEHHYTKTILKNSSYLYRKEKYLLLIQYLKCSRIRINWSDDIRLNEMNNVICQLLLSSLLKERTLNDIVTEFNNCTIIKKEFEYEGIGESMNYPVKTLEFYGLNLKFYNDVQSFYIKDNEQKNTKPIIDFENDIENLKSKTIIRELIDKMQSITPYNHVMHY